MCTREPTFLNSNGDYLKSFNPSALIETDLMKIVIVMEKYASTNKT